jgi:hypothetical protein
LQIGRSHRVPNKESTVDVFRQKLLGEDGSVRRGVVMVKQPGLFSPKFDATSSHVFTQSPQNVAVEPGIHSLACWDRCFTLPQLLYRWRHQFGIFLDTTSYVPQLSTRAAICLRISSLYFSQNFLKPIPSDSVTALQLLL